MQPDERMRDRRQRLALLLRIAREAELHARMPVDVLGGKAGDRRLHVVGERIVGGSRDRRTPSLPRSAARRARRAWKARRRPGGRRHRSAIPSWRALRAAAGRSARAARFLVEVRDVDDRPQLDAVFVLGAVDLGQFLQLAEVAGEGGLRVVVQPLAAEDQHAMPRDGDVDRPDGGIVEAAREIDPACLRGERRMDFTDFHIPSSGPEDCAPGGPLSLGATLTAVQLFGLDCPSATAVYIRILTASGGDTMKTLRVVVFAAAALVAGSASGSISGTANSRHQSKFGRRRDRRRHPHLGPLRGGVSRQRRQPGSRRHARRGVGRRDRGAREGCARRLHDGRHQHAQSRVEQPVAPRARPRSTSSNISATSSACARPSTCAWTAR